MNHTIETLKKIGEPKTGDFTIQPNSHNDVAKAIKWYKKRIEELIKEESDEQS